MTLIDEVLDGLRMQSTVFSRMTLAGGWGFAKDQLKGAPFHLLLSGRACLKTEDGGGVQALSAGDIAILPHGSPHHLLSHPDAPTLPWRQILDREGWRHWTPGMRFKTVNFRYGSGEPIITLISGVFAFGDHRRNPLLDALPSVLLVRAEEASQSAKAVAAVTALLDTELLSGKPGAETVAARLADILFIQVVRHYLSSVESLPRGWLRGIADRELAPALLTMHRTPEQPWSVATLAGDLGMSRSRFAARFQDVVGQPPLKYLTHWRMYKAAGLLVEGSIAMPALASSVGYRSEVSFSKAFKRWAGQSPAEYRRQLSETKQSAIEKQIVFSPEESQQ